MNRLTGLDRRLPSVVIFVTMSQPTIKQSPQMCKRRVRGFRGLVAVRKITRAEIARHYGCSRPWVSIALGGRRQLSPSVLRRLEAAIGRASESKRAAGASARGRGRKRHEAK